MRLKNYICLYFLLLISASVFSQDKSTVAVKTEHPPKIDGDLSDEVWDNAPALTGFIQNYPDMGKPASQPTEVKVLYDDNAIYVGAYIFDDPALIRKQFTARDAEQQTDVDYFSVFFDTYNDNQNGFQFLVTTANVQSDARLSPNFSGDFGNYGDKTWDAVWESKVSIKNDGWVVEMRIPYISLRFAKKDVQDWGIQFLRFIRRTNETCFWNKVNPQVNGFVNQFGTLKSLQSISPPLRLSFSPYVTTGYSSTPETNGYLNQWLRNGGMDVKYGINESFTLDATLIPDFGQVISDNVVNNLTPYEVQFQENRPFFTEGTELFNKAGLFYSRRVGATPSGYYGVRSLINSNPNLELIKNPARTQLYNAIKFSGRTKKKLGIGIFNAATAPMHARIKDNSTDVETKIETEPLSNYNIIVLDQAFKGRSYVTLTNTNVIRNGSARDANVTAVDFSLFDKSNTYRTNGTIRYSKIWGMDPYDGYNATLRFGKVSGNWQYYVQGNVESKDYDPNDLGYLSAANEIAYRGNISYRQFTPTDNFITYSYSLAPRLTYLYEPYKFSSFDVTGTAFWIFKNFWDVSLTTNVTPGWAKNYFELRTDGRPLALPPNYFFQISGSTDSRKKLYVRFGGVYAIAPKYDNELTSIDLGFRYRFSDRFSLDLQSKSGFEKNQLGYAFQRETNGEPIVGFRDNREVVSVLSGIYNFASRMNLTLRVRHYWNKVNYLSFHNADAEGYLLDRPFIPGQNENFNAFNLDAFFTWDFRLGSRLIIGYKNWLGDEEYTSIAGDNTYIKNLGEIFNLRHGNEVTVRFIYFFDINQLKKKR
ncbi:MAG TPA: DUF5916 domain-containing protein [Chitinophagaceae bacterium]|nr:DUF5916 domain-containing protein [Chitinophagaceae bacterium]